MDLISAKGDLDVQLPNRENICVLYSVECFGVLHSSFLTTSDSLKRLLQDIGMPKAMLLKFPSWQLVVLARPTGIHIWSLLSICNVEKKWLNYNTVASKQDVVEVQLPALVF